MTQVPRPVQTPSGGPVVATPPVDAPVGQQAGGNEALAKLRHTLMQQIWDSVPGRYDVDLLAVANGILGNPELLDALAAYRARSSSHWLIHHVVDELPYGTRCRCLIGADHNERGGPADEEPMTDITERPTE